MSTPSHVCPSPEQLLAFARGQLAELDTEQVGHHLDGCRDCQASAEAAPPDSFMIKLPRQPLAQPDTIDHVAGAAQTPLPGQLENNEPPFNAYPQIAGYTFERLLGRGGMGVVYAARHEALKRRVALKMIRAGAVAGPADLARFQAEAEAVAQLQHPNIVQIYEVGNCAGHAFMALEFCGGGTLAAKLAATPQPPRSAAELTETLARAVHTAHQRGVVHRDLKPANVLMTEAGVLKISDYGLAKRLDEDSGQTAAGAVLGTPSYMAPEQAAGKKEVGPAADTWALGAILYELLTGRPPFRGTSVPETLEQVHSQEPVPVRRLQPKVPRDLETICLKCLEKDPRKRYASAVDLADDLRRFLDSRPIHARPMRWPARALRWARRNPGWAAVLTLAFLAVFGGVAGVLVYNHDLGAALTLANENRDRAEKKYKQWRKATDFLLGIFTEDLGDKPGMHEIQRRALEKALQDLESFLEEYRDDATLEADLAVTYLHVGQITNALGKRDRSLWAYTKAVALYEKLTAAALTNRSYRRGLAAALNNLGNLQRKSGKMAAAETALHKALQIRQDLAADPAADANYQEELASTWFGLGGFFEDNGKRDEALRAHQQALAIRQRLAVAYRGSPSAQQNLAGSLNAVALLQESMGQAKGAMQAQERTATALEATLDHWPQNTALQHRLAQTCNNLGTTLKEQGRFKEAEARLRQAATLYQKVVNANPGVIVYQYDLVSNQMNLGTLLDALGNRNEGIPLLRTAAAGLKLLSEANPKDTGHKHTFAQCLNNLAGALSRLQDNAAKKDCLKYYREALALREELVRESKANLTYQHELASIRHNLAVCLRGPRQTRPEVFRLLDGACAGWKLLTRAQPRDDRFAHSLGLCYRTLASVHEDDGNELQAQHLYEKAVEAGKRLVKQHPNVPAYQDELAQCYQDLGLLHIQGGRSGQGLALWQECWALCEGLVRRFPNYPRYLHHLGVILMNLGLFHEKANRTANALTAYRAAEKYHRAAFALAPRRDYRIALGSANSNVAKMQWQLGDPEGAALSHLHVARLWSANGAMLVQMAQRIARCLPLMADPVKGEFYGSQAVALLRSAAERGAINVHRLSRDATLEPLRARKDFRQLLKSLAGSSASPKDDADF